MGAAMPNDALMRAMGSFMQQGGGWQPDSIALRPGCAARPPACHVCLTCRPLVLQPTSSLSAAAACLPVWLPCMCRPHAGRAGGDAAVHAWGCGAAAWDDALSKRQGGQPPR
jgi:hypothetical protein